MTHRMEGYYLSIDTADIGEVQQVGMPTFAEPMSVSFVNSHLMVWATVNIKDPMDKHDFMVVKTGDDFYELDRYESREWKYLGTVIGTHVYHVFHAVHIDL